MPGSADAGIRATPEISLFGVFGYALMMFLFPLVAIFIITGTWDFE